MNINCPKCNYTGTYPEQDISKRGKTISCPKCKNFMFIEKPKTKKLAKAIVAISLAGLLSLGGIFGYNQYQNFNKKKELINILKTYKINNIDINFSSVKLNIKSNVSENDAVEEMLINQINQLADSFRGLYNLWPNKENYILVLENFLNKYTCTFNSKKDELIDKNNKVFEEVLCIDSEGKERKYIEVFKDELSKIILKEWQEEYALFVNVFDNQFVSSFGEIIKVNEKRNEIIYLAMSEYKKVDVGTCELWKEDISLETRQLNNIASKLENIQYPKLRECYSYFSEFLKYNKKLREETNRMCTYTSLISDTRYTMYNDSQDRFISFKERMLSNLDSLEKCLNEAKIELSREE